MAPQRLLAFLALHAHLVNRAAIAGTLWPEASERHAYANLRAALVAARSRGRAAAVRPRPGDARVPVGRPAARLV